MSHRLSELVQKANPAPDPDRLLETMGREEFFEQVRIQAGLQEAPVVHLTPPARRSRWVLAAATAAGVIAAIVLTIVFATGLRSQPDVISPSTSLPAPGESSSPTELVNAFFAKWNERDVEGALAYLHPDARTGPKTEVGSRQWWDNYLSYSVAAYGGDWRWELRGCREPSDTTVRCRLIIAGEPLYDAAAIPAVDKQWDTRDGYILGAPLLLDVSLTDAAADRYAKQFDPVGHAAVCDIEGRDLIEELIVYDRPCGEFMAPHRLAYAAQLLGEPGDS